MNAVVSGGRQAIACPRCGGPIASTQDWCLRCGDAARTRLAPPPAWKLPIAFLVVVLALAATALALAFVEISANDPPVRTEPSNGAAAEQAPGG